MEILGGAPWPLVLQCACKIKPMAEELKHVVVMDGWNRAKEQD